MNACSFFLYTIFFLHLRLLHLQISSADNSNYAPSDDIVVNCGSKSSELMPYDGRNWTDDAGSQYVPYNKDTKSFIATAPEAVLSIPRVPYMTARIFQSKFTYRFNVTPGPKFIRLHFYPASYLNFSVSEAFLSVTSGNFTLLHNFSAYLTAEYFNSAYLIKEFIIHVSERTLELNFFPSFNSSDSYAFVNGIEVVSMPLNLYIQGDSGPLPLVGHSTVLYIDGNTALETLYRINVGGDDIPPKYDTGMFRTWTRDEGYILGASFGEEAYDLNISNLYPANVPSYTAPESVYSTARVMSPFEYANINLNYNLTWFFPVDSGFNYLVRLHFCEVDRSVTRINERVFTIFINNQTAQEGADVIALSGRYGVAAYKDFLVSIPEASNGKMDLWIDLHPDVEARPLYYNAILNGVEIFKLSSSADGNLAGINPLKIESQSSLHVPSVSQPNKPKKIIFILIGCGIGVVLLPIILCLVLYLLKMVGRKMSFCGLFVITPSRIKNADDSSLCRHFSMDKIKMATNNFDEALLIGTGGFGKVYKGSFDCGATFVAIKCSDPMSQQGVLEFETEIHVLSKLRHKNLVSLMGYCQENGEMILVYDYMANGTLYEHLHIKQTEKQPLSWTQRLEICIGVARGLHYLHTGMEKRIIHRDIKTSNVLLDHNLVAKISDFGLSKANTNIPVSTNIKGSIGYLDPEYFQCHKLTEKSDVYSFGVVLVEVVTARPAVSPVEDDDEHVNLADWFLHCFEDDIVNQMVDPELQGKIAKESLGIYIGTAKRCLAERGADRPPMGDVLQKIVLALQLQRNADMVEDGNVHISENTPSHSNSDLTPGIEFSEIIVPIGR